MYARVAIDEALDDRAIRSMDRIALAEILEGAAQRLRSEAEAEKRAARLRLRSAHVNGKVKP